MRLLIVKKPTTLDLRGDSLRSMASRGGHWQVLLRDAEVAHAEHEATLKLLRVELERAGIPFLECQRAAPRPEGTAFDAILAVGGDGTVLAANRRYPEGGWVIGIRSSSASVGWLCAGSMENIPELLHGLKTNTLKTVGVTRMIVRVERAADGTVDESFPVINDCLYLDAQPGLSTRYTIVHKGHREKHKSSGLWISTPVGSSGAIRAAGGAIMPIIDRNFQYRVRELFQGDSHGASLIGCIFSPEAEPLVVENESDQALIALDGRHGIMHLSLGDRISFASAVPLRLALPLTQL